MSPPTVTPSNAVSAGLPGLVIRRLSDGRAIDDQFPIGQWPLETDFKSNTMSSSRRHPALIYKIANRAETARRRALADCNMADRHDHYAGRQVVAQNQFVKWRAAVRHRQ